MDETTRPLTAKQQAFCREYIIDLNGGQCRRTTGGVQRTHSRTAGLTPVEEC